MGAEGASEIRTDHRQREERERESEEKEAEEKGMDG